MTIPRLPARGKISRYRVVCLPPGISATDEQYRGSDLPDGDSQFFVESDPDTKVPDRVLFQCPCGCREPYWLWCLPKHPDRPSWPTWDLTLSGDLPTLSPSVNNTAGCKSHFFIENGLVRWA